MDDEVRRAVEKVEALVKLLSGDVGELRRAVASHDERFSQLDRNFERMLETMKENEAAVRSIASSQAAMASAMTQAMAQLTLAQSLEKRVDRLEAAVFPPKH